MTRRVLAFLLLGALAGCGRAGASAPTSPAEPGPSFLSEAHALCVSGCSPLDALWAASEVAGAMTMRCECRRLPNLGTEPAVRRRGTR